MLLHKKFCVSAQETGIILELAIYYALQKMVKALAEQRTGTIAHLHKIMTIDVQVLDGELAPLENCDSEIQVCDFGLAHSVHSAKLGIVYTVGVEISKTDSHKQLGIDRTKSGQQTIGTADGGFKLAVVVFDEQDDSFPFRVRKLEAAKNVIGKFGTFFSMAVKVAGAAIIDRIAYWFGNIMQKHRYAELEPMSVDSSGKLGEFLGDLLQFHNRF